jgi:hypothetical protein
MVPANSEVGRIAVQACGAAGCATNTESTSPSRRMTALSPAQLKLLCVEMTNVVRPRAGTRSAADATAAHPARAPAYGPTTASPTDQSGMSRNTGSRSRMPSAATSARFFAPTSTHSSSSVGGTLAAPAAPRHRCVLRTATTPGIARTRAGLARSYASTMMRCPMCAWCQSGGIGREPDTCTRR